MQFGDPYLGDLGTILILAQKLKAKWNGSF